MLFKQLELFKRMTEGAKVVKESCSFSRTFRPRSKRLSSSGSSERVNSKSPTRLRRRDSPAP